jgi:hypothetical protein
MSADPLNGLVASSFILSAHNKARPRCRDLASINFGICVLSPIAAAATVAAATTAAAAAATTVAATTATASAATTITTAAATTAGAGTGFTGLGFIDGQSAAIMFLAIECGNGCIRLRIGSHLNETETLGATGVAIRDDFSTFNGAVRGEQSLQSGAIDIVAQITNV